MKKIFPFFLITYMIISCKEPAANVPIAKAPVDSLMKAWSDGWNNHDSATVINLFAADALLIDDNLVATGAESISTKWISPNIRVVSNFKALQLQQWSTAERAGYTGKYEFEAVVNDSIVAKPKGAFSLNWIKGDQGGWKITSATIHGFKEKNN